MSRRPENSDCKFCMARQKDLNEHGTGEPSGMDFGGVSLANDSFHGIFFLILNSVCPLGERVRKCR